MIQAIDVCGLLYNSSTTVGYRFKLADNTYADVDADTFNFLNQLPRLRVLKSTPVYLVGDECKTKAEIEQNISVQDISENSEVVSIYISSILELRKNEVLQKQSATLEYTPVDSTKGYLKYTIKSPEDFIKEFTGMNLTREALSINIEKYGLGEYKQYILSKVPREAY
jgi:hypothetical protein